MFQFFSSFGASSNFQKHRLILTAKGYQAPDQYSLKKIIQTFRGEDEQTRSQIAFATIVKKIHTSDSKQNWIYLLKNLLILDRVVQQNCFLEQIAALTLAPIENYQESNQQGKALNSERILKSFWRLIQQKSKLLSRNSIQQQAPSSNSTLKIPGQNNNNTNRPRNASFTSKPSLSNKNIISRQKSHENNKSSDQSQHHSRKQSSHNYQQKRNILSVGRSQKQQFLKTLNNSQLYRQSLDLEALFESIFTFIFHINYSTGEKRSTNQPQQHLLQQSNPQTNPNVMKKKDQHITQNIDHLANLPHYNPTLNSANTILPNDKNKVIKQQFFNSPLIKYLHLQVLYKLLSLYTNQSFCIKAFINLLENQNRSVSSPVFGQKKHVNRFSAGNLTNNEAITEKQINQWKKVIIIYLNYAERIVNYVQTNKVIKGFELINYRELRPFENVNIIQMLDQYIEHKNMLEEPDMVEVQELGFLMQAPITVQKKSQFSFEKKLTPRRTFQIKRKTKDQNNPFYDWQNSYSKNFPPKQVLTLDLIMEMRQNPSNQHQGSDDQASIYQPFATNRHSCIYNYRQSNISLRSDFEFIHPIELRKKQLGQLQSPIGGNKKTKDIYYFKAQKDEPVKSVNNGFKNIYSSLTNGENAKSLKWIR